MNEQNYTSKELSQWLAENGCELESEYCYNLRHNGKDFYYDFGETTRHKKAHYPMVNNKKPNVLPAYDILNDICVRYAKEFFGNGEDICHLELYYPDTTYILSLLQQNKKQEAEQYIKNHCLFNDHCKRNNINHHSIDVNGHCNMGCC